MNTQNTKAKRGRPKNSVCFTNMKLSDLLDKYSPDTILPVGRLWLKAQNTQNFTPVETQTPAPAVVVESSEPKIEFSLVD